MKETKKLIFLVALAFLVGIHQFVFLPNLHKTRSLENTIITKENQLEELENLTARYLASRQQKPGETKILPQNFSLLVFLAKTAEDIKIKSNLVDVKISPDEKKGNYLQKSVRFTLESIGLQQLVSFLKEVEQGAYPVFIPGFQLRQNKDQTGMVDVNMEMLVLQEFEQKPDSELQIPKK